MHCDAVYTCNCGERFIDDQLAYERHLAEKHNCLRDTLPSITTSLSGLSR